MSTAIRRRVKDPDGTEWTIGRVWFGRRTRPDWRSKYNVGDAVGAGSDGLLNAFDGTSFEGGLILVAAGIAAVLILIPVLLFGLELIAVGFLLGIGLVSRSIFGKPWTVTALRSGARAPEAEWRVRGWGASRNLIRHLCLEVEAGRQLPTDLPGATYLGGTGALEPASTWSPDRR